jgi:hypothetical protein
MSEARLQNLLRDVLEDLLYARDNPDELDDDLLIERTERASSIRSISTFAEAGVLTHNRGLVIEVDDGRTFQVKIVRSR